MDLKSALLGVAAGLAAGALLGVLFAPEKGSKTRKGISKKGMDLVDEVKEKFNDFLESMSAKLEEVKEDASDFTEQHKISKAKEA
jgi:gas vesicle protein